MKKNGRSVISHGTVAAALLVCAAWVAGCDVTGLAGPRDRTNPYDRALSFGVSRDIRYPVFEDPHFVYPRKIALSDDGRYMAVVSEMHGFLGIYDRDSGGSPIEIEGYEAFHVTDMAFGNGHLLYVLTEYSFTRINLDTLTRETLYADSQYPRMNLRLLSIDRSPTSPVFYLYGNDDNWQTRQVFVFQAFEDYPRGYTQALCGSLFQEGVPDSIEIEDFAVNEGFLYFIPAAYCMNKYGIFSWDTAGDSFLRQIHYSGAQWLSSDSLTAFQDPSFEPFSLDVRNGSLYCFANGPDSDAVFRWDLPGQTGPGGTEEPYVWAAGMDSAFENVNHNAYVLAADPSDSLHPDRVFIGETLKWLDINRITLWDIAGTQPEETVQGRDYRPAELALAQDAAVYEDRLFFLDVYRGLVMEAGLDGAWRANYGEGILTAFEVSSFSVSDGSIYVADYDYGIDAEIIRKLSLADSSFQTVINLPSSSGEIRTVHAMPDGRLLLWYPFFNGGIGTDELRVYTADGTLESIVPLSGTGVRDLRMASGPSGTVYIAYSVDGSAETGVPGMLYTVIDRAGSGLDTVERVFSTMDTGLFNYDYSAWNMSVEAFSLRDLAVSPGGFVWAALGRGIILRLYPPGTFLDTKLHFQLALGQRDGRLYSVSDQPLSDIDMINANGGIGNLVVSPEGSLGFMDGNEGRLRFLTPGG
ncbi:MAG: hypothetical protein JXB03_02460 [Spirochaetales bacterium]|nr:hypothetical protein [Spirochaetales bacterium]